MGETYESAGVSIEAGARAVDRIKDIVRKTHSPEVLSSSGGFGALYALPFGKFRDPVLVASTDGVGTKTKIAAMAGRYDTIGEDLVHHCANDILTVGATPQFFLDYVGTGRMEPEAMEDVVAGLAKGCLEVGCSLIGGEMAEMPDI